MLRVLKPGLQSSLQGPPRFGARQYGIPYAGPADSVSMALANRLVGNQPSQTALEITYGGFSALVEADCAIAIAGANDQALVSGQTAPSHQTLHVKAGEEVQLPPVARGARTYLAIRSGFQADELFGSSSTYMPAGFGGVSGRALKDGDQLIPIGNGTSALTLETPAGLKPVFTHNFALRSTPSAEVVALSDAARETLFSESFTVGRQATRMGLPLTGHTLELETDGLMKSAPVFPGTIQCPASGDPIILLCDAQTTGGYPRIATIARCDRHVLGQIRPGDRVTLLERSPEDAAKALEQKEALLKTWLDTPQSGHAFQLY